MTIEEQIAQRIDKTLDGDCGYGVGAHLAAAVMPLVKRAQAEAWAEGAQWAAVECGVIPSEQAAWVTPGDNPYIEKRA